MTYMVYNDYFYPPKTEERIAEDLFIVTYTYEDGCNYEIEMNRDELAEDYEIVKTDYAYEELIKYEVFSVYEEYIGDEVIRRLAEELLYAEEM